MLPNMTSFCTNGLDGKSLGHFLGKLTYVVQFNPVFTFFNWLKTASSSLRHDGYVTRLNFEKYDLLRFCIIMVRDYRIIECPLN